MARLASQDLALDPRLLLLAMQLRPSDNIDAMELMLLARKERDEAEAARKEREPKVGETRTVAVTISTIDGMTVDGIGKVPGGLSYGVITYEVTQNGVAAEKRAVWGQNTSGYMTFNE